VKKLIFLVVFFIFAASVFGATIPWPAYCEHQGYTYENNREIGINANIHVQDSDGSPTEDLPVTITVSEPEEEWRSNFCVFDDGNKCDAKEFLEGTCGKEYVREIPCRQEGEFVFKQFEECCSGVAYIGPKVTGQPQCHSLAVYFTWGHISNFLLFSVIFNPLAWVLIFILVIVTFWIRRALKKKERGM